MFCNIKEYVVIKDVTCTYYKVRFVLVFCISTKREIKTYRPTVIFCI